eukprot:10040451-Heterocapsa_arctica.AAC.1
MPMTPLPDTPPGGVYYDTSPATSVDGHEKEPLPAYLREFRPDEEVDVPALCCRLGIAGLFKGPDQAINGDNMSSTLTSSTRYAFPASSIADDEETDVPPWETFENENKVENKYCDSRASFNPPSHGLDDVFPAMPCTQ